MYRDTAGTFYPVRTTSSAGPSWLKIARQHERDRRGVTRGHLLCVRAGCVCTLCLRYCFVFVLRLRVVTVVLLCLLVLVMCVFMVIG